MNNWIAFAYRTDWLNRVAELGEKDAHHETDRGFEAAGLNSSIDVRATRPEAEAVARDLLGRLRAAEPSVPWRACFADPYGGKCYAVDE